jgi:hypothetical protein
MASAVNLLKPFHGREGGAEGVLETSAEEMEEQEDAAMGSLLAIEL